MCNFLLASLCQNDGQVSLGTNPFSSQLPWRCLTYPHRDLLGGGGGGVLRERNKRSVCSLSGMVPPSHEEDVIPPIIVCVLHTVASL